jgi:hypothetical protein
MEDNESLLRNEMLMAYLIFLKNHDYDKYMNLVIEAIQNSEDTAVSDPSPIEDKLRALDSILSHCEVKEDYETCVFIRELKSKIENAGKE